MTEEQARAAMYRLLAALHQAGGSDLLIAHDFPPSMKYQGSLQAMTQQALSADTARLYAQALMNDRQRAEFARDLECHFAIAIPGLARFQVTVYMQQQNVAMVVRSVSSAIPDLDALGLPAVLRELVMHPCGLVLVVGGRGSGKATTLAAMLDHRNSSAAGHIVTVEDPVRFAHVSKKSLLSQREVGLDTHSWQQALKSIRRLAPDVVLIGQIRDAQTMAHAIAIAQAGQLCLGTLQASSARRALDRILHFFPAERHPQLQRDLSAHLRAIVAQRLVHTEDGAGRKAAIEILLNTPPMAACIGKGAWDELPGIMAHAHAPGMRTLDQALLQLYDEGCIDHAEALRHADSADALHLAMQHSSRRGAPASAA